MELVQTEAYEIDQLAQLSSAEVLQAGILVGAKVGLFVDPDVTPTSARVDGDYTPPGYTGYAEQTATWTAPTIDDQGRPTLVSNTMTFRPTDALGSTTIAWGVKVQNTGETKLYASGKFAKAEPLGKATDELKIALKINPDGTMEAIRVA